MLTLDARSALVEVCFRGVANNEESDMLYRVASVLVLSILVCGCTSYRASALLAADHPANPDASSTPILHQSLTLSGSDAVAPIVPGQTPGISHEMAGMSHPMPGVQHDHQSPGTVPATTQAALLYTCRMHKEVVSDKPGKCPECGMKLVMKQDGKMAKHGEHE